MKKSIRNVLCCGALFASLTLTSCGSVDPTAVKSIKVSGGEENVYQYNAYDYSNLKLQVTKNNGDVSYIPVDESMITKRIDSRNTGKQTLEITYNGKKYVLTVNINASPKADALHEKITNMYSVIEEGAKEAETVTLRIKFNAGTEYFPGNEDYEEKSGSNATGQPIQTMEITFTKEQIANGDLTKALALLQLAVERGDVITESTDDGEKVYATVNVSTFFNGLIDILAENSDYFKQLMLEGKLNVGGWQDMFAGMLFKLQSETGIALNAQELETAVFDAFAYMLKGASAIEIGNTLISEIQEK